MCPRFALITTSTSRGVPVERSMSIADSVTVASEAICRFTK